MGKIKTLQYLALGTGIVSLPVGYAIYKDEDLRENLYLYQDAFKRQAIVGYAGLKMGLIYKFSSQTMSEKHERASLILRDAFMKNGGFYIKTGQLIASLDVIVPEIYRRNFEMLCHNCKESSYEDVKYTIEHQLKQPIEQIFSDFEKKPVKSASIGQVHKAVLKENNKQVAVKVMHKWLLEQSPGDVKLIKKFINIGEYFFPEFKFQWFGEEVEKNLYQELDFQREVKNGEISRQNLKNVKGVSIPKNYMQYCTKSIIVMDWLNGIPIMNIEQLKSSGLDLKKVSTEISTAFNKMIHIDGFCHADPHQGNFLVRFNEKNETEVVILDHGLYVTLSESTKMSYSKLWKGIITQDPNSMKSAAMELGVQEDQFQLLVSMVTSRKYSDVIDKELDMKNRLDSPSDVEHRQQLSKFGVEYSTQICDILNNLNREMLLLFKTKEFLRTIDNKLGLPINSFQITLDYCYKCLDEYNLAHHNQKQGFSRFFEILGRKYQHLKLNLLKVLIFMGFIKLN